MRFVLNEFKAGKLKTPAGKTVKDKRQAIAIAISETKKVKKDLTPSDVHVPSTNWKYKKKKKKSSLEGKVVVVKAKPVPTNPKIINF